jgi:hypothetical protein
MTAAAFVYFSAAMWALVGLSLMWRTMPRKARPERSVFDHVPGLPFMVGLAVGGPSLAAALELAAKRSGIGEVPQGVPTDFATLVRHARFTDAADGEVRDKLKKRRDPRRPGPRKPCV